MAGTLTDALPRPEAFQLIVMGDLLLGPIPLSMSFFFIHRHTAYTMDETDLPPNISSTELEHDLSTVTTGHIVVCD